MVKKSTLLFSANVYMHYFDYVEKYLDKFRVLYHHWTKDVLNVDNLVALSAMVIYCCVRYD